MIYLALVFLSILSSYLFNKLNINFNIKQIINIQKQSFIVLKTSSITDEEKQKTLLINSKQLFISSILLFVKFIFIFLPIAIIFIYDYFKKTNFYLIVIDWKGMLISSISFVLFLILFNKYDSRRIQ